MWDECIVMWVVEIRKLFWWRRYRGPFELWDNAFYCGMRAAIETGRAYRVRKVR